MRQLYWSLTLFIPIIFASPAIAKDYIMLAEKGYAQWRCAAVARIGGDDEQKTKGFELFKSGYIVLVELITDISDGKVDSGDIIGMPDELYNGAVKVGGTIDFKLGYIWSDIERASLEESAPETGHNLDFEAYRSIIKFTARENFKKRNCGLL